jgi:hypothetical protein
VNDSRTRPSHAALDGKVYRHDHRFWDTWYPPNGFRCRCSVRSLSDDELAEFDLTVETEDPTGRLFEPRDPETGVRMPPRPLMPDPGWAHNPAKEAWKPDLTKYRPAVRAHMEAPKVRTRADLEELFATRLQAYSKRGPINVRYSSANYFAATNSLGRITLSTRTFRYLDNFNESRDVLEACKRLGRGETLTFNQEYAIEAVWHEIMHNSQQFTYRAFAGSWDTDFMETINQWVARWTYPEMVERLGFDKTLLTHQDEIIKRGLGYGSYVDNFRATLQALGIPEQSLVEALRDIHDNWPERMEYVKPVTKLLAERSGRTEDQITSVFSYLFKPSTEFKEHLREFLH